MHAIDSLFQAIDANDRMALEQMLRQHPTLQQGARRKGRTPLHVAVETALASTVLALLQHDAEINAIVEGVPGTVDPKVGYTALHLAVTRGNRQILELLLAARGVDVFARTPQGETASALARVAMRPGLLVLVREREERSGHGGASPATRR